MDYSVTPRFSLRRKAVEGTLCCYNYAEQGGWAKYFPEKLETDVLHHEREPVPEKHFENCLKRNGKWLVFGSSDLCVAVADCMLQYLGKQVLCIKRSVEAVGGHQVCEVHCSAKEKGVVLKLLNERFAGAKPRWKTNWDTVQGKYSESFLKAKEKEEKDEKETDDA